MRSSFSRRRLASHASFRRSGRASRGHCPGPLRRRPPFVAITRPSGYGWSASAISFSLTSGPYESAVSIRSMPSSTTRRSRRLASFGSSGEPQMPFPVIRMAPKPSRWTSRSPPSVKLFTPLTLARDTRRSGWTYADAICWTTGRNPDGSELKAADKGYPLPPANGSWQTDLRSATPVGIDGPQWVLEYWSDINNVFQFVRVEDIAYDKRPGMGNVVYIADSGRGRTDAQTLDTPFRSTNGRVWKMELDPTDPEGDVAHRVRRGRRLPPSRPWARSTSRTTSS